MVSRPHNPQQEPSEELGKGHPSPTPVPSQLPPHGAKGVPERFFHQLRNPLRGKRGRAQTPSSETLVDICKPRSCLHFGKQNLPNLQFPPGSELPVAPSAPDWGAQDSTNPSELLLRGMESRAEPPGGRE